MISDPSSTWPAVQEAVSYGLPAILAGNLVLFAYVGALTHHTGSTRENFAPLGADTFDGGGFRPATRPNVCIRNPTRQGGNRPHGPRPASPLTPTGGRSHVTARPG